MDRAEKAAEQPGCQSWSRLSLAAEISFLVERGKKRNAIKS